MKPSPTNPIEDLQAIRNIMERSSKFLSLSGLAGVFAGVCALAGAGIAWLFILPHKMLPDAEIFRGNTGSVLSATGWILALEALVILVLAFGGAFFLSHRKARQTGLPFLTAPSRLWLLHLTIPLITGGLFILILLISQKPELAASAMLVFYGLALVNAGKFTFSEIHYLGLTEVTLGILAGFCPQYGFLLWSAGFGLMHVIYGTLMYYRYERDQTTNHKISDR